MYRIRNSFLLRIVSLGLAFLLLFEGASFSRQRIPFRSQIHLTYPNGKPFVWKSPEEDAALEIFLDYAQIPLEGLERDSAGSVSIAELRKELREPIEGVIQRTRGRTLASIEPEDMEALSTLRKLSRFLNREERIIVEEVSGNLSAARIDAASDRLEERLRIETASSEIFRTAGLAEESAVAFRGEIPEIGFFPRWNNHWKQRIQKEEERDRLQSNRESFEREEAAALSVLSRDSWSAQEAASLVRSIGTMQFRKDRRNPEAGLVLAENLRRRIETLRTEALSLRGKDAGKNELGRRRAFQEGERIWERARRMEEEALREALKERLRPFSLASGNDSRMNRLFALAQSHLEGMESREEREDFERAMAHFLNFVVEATETVFGRNRNGGRAEKLRAWREAQQRFLSAIHERKLRELEAREGTTFDSGKRVLPPGWSRERYVRALRDLMEEFGQTVWEMRHFSNERESKSRIKRLMLDYYRATVSMPEELPYGLRRLSTTDVEWVGADPRYIPKAVSRQGGLANCVIRMIHNFLKFGALAGVPFPFSFDRLSKLFDQRFFERFPDRFGLELLSALREVGIPARKEMIIPSEEELLRQLENNGPLPAGFFPDSRETGHAVYIHLAYREPRDRWKFVVVDSHFDEPKAYSFDQLFMRGLLVTPLKEAWQMEGGRFVGEARARILDRLRRKIETWNETDVAGGNPRSATMALSNHLNDALVAEGRFFVDVSERYGVGRISRERERFSSLEVAVVPVEDGEPRVQVEDVAALEDPRETRRFHEQLTRVLITGFFDHFGERLLDTSESLAEVYETAMLLSNDRPESKLGFRGGILTSGKRIPREGTLIRIRGEETREIRHRKLKNVLRALRKWPLSRDVYLEVDPAGISGPVRGDEFIRLYFPDDARGREFFETLEEGPFSAGERSLSAFERTPIPD